MMRFIEIPEPYSSAVSPAMFILDGADVDKTVTVEILDADSGAIVGKQRLKGLARYTINAAPYFRPLFPLSPVVNSVTYVVPYYDCIRNCRLRVGELLSETVPLVFCSPRRSPVPAGALMTDMPLRRTLAAGESDELRIVSLDGSIAARFSMTLADGSVQEFEMSTEEMEKMVGAIVDLDSLQRRTGADISRFTVALTGSEGLSGEVSYEVVERGSDACRVVWVNSYGASDYYTFDRIGQRRLQVGRIRSGEDHPNAATILKTVLSLDSGIRPRAEAEALAGILSSPAVWIVENRRAKAVRVETDGCTLDAFGCPNRLSLQLSYTETVSLTV